MSKLEKRRYGKRVGTYDRGWDNVHAIRCGNQTSDETHCHVVHEGDDGELTEDELEDVNLFATARYSAQNTTDKIQKVGYVDGEFSLLADDRNIACIVDERDRLRCGDKGIVKDVAREAEIRK